MIRVPPKVWADTLSAFRRCGAAERECVVYWTGPAEDPSIVDETCHPDHVATPWHYAVEDRWLTAFWLDLARRGRSARVQVHTHAREAFHSATDDAWPLVTQAGFLSLVLPSFGLDPRLDEQGVRAGDLYLARIDDRLQWRQVEVPRWLELG